MPGIIDILTTDEERLGFDIRAIELENWWFRAVRPEFWPYWAIYGPVAIYAVFSAIRSWSCSFWSTTNPGIPTGGMLGENKADISELIPEAYRPKSCLINRNVSIGEQLRASGITFPVVIKPVIGRRGRKVAKLLNLGQLEAYFKVHKDDFLVEQFIEAPIEAAVYYWRNPETGASGISSVALKDFLRVTGDGTRTIAQLLAADSRKQLQLPRLLRQQPDLMKLVLNLGETKLLEPIGNHNRGTTFLDARYLITPNMVAAFDHIHSQLSGIWLCRFDLKATSLDDLQTGNNLIIMEINGVCAELAHIYQPNYPLHQLWGDTLRQWRKIYEIGTANHRLGAKYLTWTEFFEYNRRENASLR